MLESKCVSCHNPDKVKGELLLHTRAETLKGGETGPAVVEKDVAKSLLVERMALPHDSDDLMPPKGDPLTPGQIEKFKAWINAGAPWPEKLVLKEKTVEEVEAILAARAKMERVRKLEIFPAEFSLETKRDYHKALVLATFDDDTTQDISDLCKLEIADANLVTREGSVLRPKADGQTTLTARFGKASVSAPIKVSGASTDRPVSFNLDVMPVFHAGRLQHRRMPRSLPRPGRLPPLPLRLQPAERLLHRHPRDERKAHQPRHPRGIVPAAEGHRDRSSYRWQALRSGLRGVRHHRRVDPHRRPREDPEEIATVTGIDIYPKQVVMEGEGAQQQITVRASYSDGTDRDVHALGRLHDEQRRRRRDRQVRTGHGGGARGRPSSWPAFDAYTAGTQAIVIPKNLQYTKPRSDARNYVDELVEAKLHKLRILPSGICDDQTFIRRVYADIIGALPTPTEQDAFLADKAPDKRERLIDLLLEKKEFTDMWVMKWAELLQIHSQTNQLPLLQGAPCFTTPGCRRRSPTTCPSTRSSSSSSAPPGAPSRTRP